MAIDYRKLCIEVFGTDDEQEIRHISEHIKNGRNAGRKKKYNQLQVDKMRKLRSEGYSASDIAQMFDTTRQTISRYLHQNYNDIDDSYVQEIDFMYNDEICTMMFVDYLNQNIQIFNQTQDILHRAFGNNENPTWDDFENFLRERCFSENRGDTKYILDLLNIDSYDPIQIINVTHGKIYDDDQWLRITGRKIKWNK